MSGYRTLHRFSQQQSQSKSPDADSGDQGTSADELEPWPLFAAQFSPCSQTPKDAHHQSHPPSRLLTASADGFIYCYALNDKMNKADVLDASALSMNLEGVLLPSSDKSCASSSPLLSLGCAALSVVRNYVGEDVKAGEEITAGMRLDGLVTIWKRPEQPSTITSSTSGKVSADDQNENDGDSPVKERPHEQFHIKDATGTTMVIIPPQITGFSRHGIILMVGCLDGSISFVCAGVGIPDSRKCNDASKFSPAGTILDTIGSGNSISLSLALCPFSNANMGPSLTFAVGRKNGSIDIYSSGGSGNDSHSHAMTHDDLYGNIRRCHRLTHHAGAPVRSLCYTPDGSLLISGCDEGHIYIHDTSSFHSNESIRMVASILNAHRGYILSIKALPDGKRFVSSSADKTVKVWDVSMPNAGPVHTFDTGHENMVWDVACTSDGKRCASCGDDGLIQIYSCDE